MREPAKHWLIKDVVSHFAPYEVYGKAGTGVIILHDHFDMMIVEDSTGNIFHSRTDNLTNVPPGNTPAPLKIKEPVEQPLKKALKPKKNIVSINQNNLF